MAQTTTALHFFSRMFRHTVSRRFTLLIIGVVSTLVAMVLLRAELTSIPNVTYVSKFVIFLLFLPVAYVFGLLLYAIGGCIVTTVMFVLAGKYVAHISAFIRNISSLAHSEPLDSVHGRNLGTELSLDDAIAEHDVLLARVRAFEYNDMFLTSALGLTVYLGFFLSAKFFLLSFIILLFVLYIRTAYALFRQEIKTLLSLKK